MALDKGSFINYNNVVCGETNTIVSKVACYVSSMILNCACSLTAKNLGHDF